MVSGSILTFIFVVGAFCNWTWDGFLCWPPTPGGVLAHLHCPAGWHGVDTQSKNENIILHFIFLLFENTIHLSYS